MRVALEAIPLACCAVEAGTALIAPPSVPEVEWTSDAPDLTVVVLAGTITQANVAEIEARLNGVKEPKIVVAYGVCASSGGPYWDSPSVLQGWPTADIFVPGCPPPPRDLWSAVTDALLAVRDAH